MKAVMPILAIVLLLCFTIAPIPPSILMTFLVGAALLIVGMLFFNVGVELSMTVPFIMAFGIGISAIRSDKHAADDSFGLVSMGSIGPILAVIILGIIYKPESSEQVSASIPDIANTVDLWRINFEI